MWPKQSSGWQQSRVWCPLCNKKPPKGGFFCPHFLPSRGNTSGAWCQFLKQRRALPCVAWRRVFAPSRLRYAWASWAWGSSPRENKLYGSITRDNFLPFWYQFQERRCALRLFESSKVRLFESSSVLLFGDFGNNPTARMFVKFGTVKNFMELYLFEIGWHETAPSTPFWYIVFDRYRYLMI